MGEQTATRDTDQAPQRSSSTPGPLTSTPDTLTSSADTAAPAASVATAEQAMTQLQSAAGNTAVASLMSDAPPADPPAAAAGPDLAGIDPVLVDEELAEHERWGSAAATVGETGSAERAGWIAEQVGSGLGTGAATGAVAGLATSLGSRAAIRLLARRIPVPVIGSIIGGAIGAWGLYGQLFTAQGWADVTGKIGAFGTGASEYEKAANTIDAIATVLDVLGNGLDTLALFCGAAALILWGLAIPTVGATTPFASAASALGVTLGTASAALGLVKMAMQPLVLLLRSLHAFTDKADPREVQTRGSQINSAASAIGGVVGAFAATSAGNRAADRAKMPANPADSTHFGDRAPGRLRPTHPEGPVVEAQPVRPSPILDSSGRPYGTDDTPVIEARPGPSPIVDQYGQPYGAGPREDVHLFGPDDPLVPRAPLPEGEPLIVLTGIERPQAPAPTPSPVLDGTGQPYGAGPREDVHLFSPTDPVTGPRSVADDEPLISLTGFDAPQPRDLGGPSPLLVRDAAGDYPVPERWNEGRILGPDEPLVPRAPLPDDRPLVTLTGIEPPEPRVAPPDTRSVIIDEAALGLPPGSVVTTPGTPRPAAAGPQTDVDYAALTGTSTPTVEQLRAALPREEATLGYGSAGPLVGPDGTQLPGVLGPFRGEHGMPVTDPATGQSSWRPEARLEQFPAAQPGHATYVVRVGPAGKWGAQTFSGPREQALAQAQEYAKGMAAAGENAARQQSATPYAWSRDATHGVPYRPPTPGEFQVNVFEMQPGGAGISSVAGPMPESAPELGPVLYSGGGPQTQLPPGAIPDKTQPVSTHYEMANPFRSAESFANRAAEYRPAGLPPLSRWDESGDAAQVGDLSYRAMSSDTASAGTASGGTPGSSPTGSPGGYARDGDAVGLVTSGRGETGTDAQAGAARQVERVNPDYERPPGTPEQLANLRQAIHVARVSREQAIADAASASLDQAETARRSQRLTELGTNMSTVASETGRQQERTAETASANAEQQSKQEEAGTNLTGSASRMAGLATLETMLAGWATGTSVLASIVDVVDAEHAVGIRQSGNDARRFMAQLTESKMVVQTQQAQHPLQMGRLNTDAQTLATERQRGEATQATNESSSEQVAGMCSQNEQDANAAEQARQQADADAAHAGSNADTLQSQHDQLAAALQSWSMRHAEQRRAAVAATCDRLTAAGYEVVNAPTW